MRSHLFGNQYVALHSVLTISVDGTRNEMSADVHISLGGVVVSKRDM